VKPKAPHAKEHESGLSLPQLIVFKALVAMDAGKTEVALALFAIIAEYFDWGDGENKLETNGARMARTSPDRDKT
jgi:hypothetical protein